MRYFTIFISLLFLLGPNDVSGAIDLKDLKRIKKFNKALKAKSTIDNYNQNKKHKSYLLWEEESSSISQHYQCITKATKDILSYSFSSSPRKKMIKKLNKSLTQYEEFYFNVTYKKQPIKYYKAAKNMSNRAVKILESINWNDYPTEQVVSLSSIVECYYHYKGNLRNVAQDSDVSKIRDVSKSERNSDLVELSGAHRDTVFLTSLVSGSKKTGKKRQLSFVDTISKVKAEKYKPEKKNQKFLLFSERVIDYKKSCECFKDNQGQDKFSYGVDNFCSMFETSYINLHSEKIMDMRQLILLKKEDENKPPNLLSGLDFKKIDSENKVLFKTLTESLSYNAQFKANSGLQCSLNHLLNNSQVIKL